MGLKSAEDIDNFSRDQFPEYTAKERQELRKTHSPEQLAALEAAEAAVDPRDLAVQGRLRDDPYRLQYIEDFKNRQPAIDKRVKTKPPPNLNARFMNMEEFTDDLGKWAAKFFPEGMRTKTLKDFVQDDLKDVPEDQWPSRARENAERKLNEYALSADGKLNFDGDGPSSTEILNYVLKRSAMVGIGEGSNTALAPTLPKEIPGVSGMYESAIDPEDEGEDDLGEYKELKKLTGMTVKELKSFQIKVLVRRSVVNQTRLGKIRSADVMAVAGNGDGWLGLGIARATESVPAMDKARLAAIREMRPIRRYENRTIYGTVEAKVSGSVVRLSARPPGKEFFFPSFFLLPLPPPNPSEQNPKMILKVTPKTAGPR